MQSIFSEHLPFIWKKNVEKKKCDSSFLRLPMLFGYSYPASTSSGATVLQVGVFPSPPGCRYVTLISSAGPLSPPGTSTRPGWTDTTDVKSLFACNLVLSRNLWSGAGHCDLCEFRIEAILPLSGRRSRHDESVWGTWGLFKVRTVFMRASDWRSLSALRIHKEDGPLFLKRQPGP